MRMISFRHRTGAAALICGILAAAVAGGCASVPEPAVAPALLIGEWRCYIDGREMPMVIHIRPDNVFESVVTKRVYIEASRGVWQVDGRRLTVMDGRTSMEFRIVSPTELRKEFSANELFPEGVRAIYRKVSAGDDAP